MARKLRFTVLLAAVFLSWDVVTAQTQSSRGDGRPDSFVNRLSGAKHVGLRNDQELGGFVLYVYNDAQHAKNIESLAQFRKDIQEHDVRIASVEQRLREAQQQRRDLEEQRALMAERARMKMATPRSEFANSIVLYDVVRLGVDYIELRSAERPGGSVILPTGKIYKLYTATQSDSDDSAADAPLDAPETE